MRKVMDEHMTAVREAMDLATRIADESAIAHIECNGERISETGHYIFCPDEIASDNMLSECIDHLCWRGLATRIDKSDEVEVILYD